MKRLRRFLPATLLVIGLTVSYIAVSAAQSPTVPAIEAADAAPAAGPAGTPGIVADGGGKASGAADSASQPDPTDVDTGKLIADSYDAVRQKSWPKILAALGLIFVIFGSRGAFKKVPKFGPFINTNFGGMLWAFALSFVGAFAHAVMTTGKIDGETAYAAVLIGAAAVGGWSGMWKKLPWTKGGGTDDE